MNKLRQTLTTNMKTEGDAQADTHLGRHIDTIFIALCFVSSPEPKDIGEPIGWDSSRRPSVCSHFQT